MKFFHPLFLFFFSLKLIFIFCNYSFSNENISFQSINIYGSPGYIDMPSAKSFNDGQITFSTSKDSETLINALSFQALPRVFGVFRYSGIGKTSSSYIDSGYSYWDRSFDVRVNLIKQNKIIPDLTIGLKDIIGTGINQSEYIVASKDLLKNLSTSIGLGWGRLGTSNVIGKIGERNIQNVGRGGKLAYKHFFTGNVGLFYGLNYKPTGNLSLKAELSSDSYENVSSFYSKSYKSAYNFGADYFLNDAISLSYFYAHNNSMGLQMNVSVNPNTTTTSNYLDNLPQPFYSTPYPVNHSDETYWENITRVLTDEEKINTVSYKTDKDEIIICVESLNKFSETLIIGRTLRVLSRYVPLTYNILTIILAENGIPVTQVSFSRNELEVLIDAPNAELLTERIATIKTAPNKIYDAKVLYNNFNKLDWSVRPYYDLALFDPNKPLYWDLGTRLSSKIKFKPGLSISGTADIPIYTNYDEIWRGVKGNLPHVRTDHKNYLNNTDPKIRNLLITSLFKLDSNLYGRLEAGYFEPSYAGVSSEILYFPSGHNFSIGAELNYSKSRDYRQLFKLKELEGLSEINGHISGYWDTGYYDYLSQIDVGKYLAGDKGGTLKLTRDFRNGWKVGGFFTITDAPFSDFGEGSFDKGIFLKIPTHSVAPFDTKGLLVSETIRPISGDGGARMIVPNRLYDTLYRYTSKNLKRTWPNIWR